MRKSLFRILAPCALLALAAWAAVGPLAPADPAASPERLVVPLSKPGQPAALEAEIMFGAVKVSGYDGKDVIIDATPRAKTAKGDGLAVAGFGPGSVWAKPGKGAAPVASLPAPAAPPAASAPAKVAVNAPVALDVASPFFGGKSDKEKQEKAAGLKPVPLAGSGLTVEEEDNVVNLQVESWRQAYDLDIKVPAGSSVKLQGSNLDSIVIENVAGAIEVSTVGGGIKLSNVSGAVVAESNNGDIDVVFNRVPPGKPMSFVTFNGDVDLTLPAEAKATFRIKSSQGEVFTDFDLALKSVPAEPEKASERDGGKFRISLDRAVLGSINGGGAEMKVQNFMGNIYIRKKK